MALCYYCSGTARCHVCSGTGVQGDGRVCAVCGGSGKCTHCSGGVMRSARADLHRRRLIALGVPGFQVPGLATGGLLLGLHKRKGAGMALCYYCSGKERCHVCSGTGVQGDRRVCPICGGNGWCTHSTGAIWVGQVCAGGSRDGGRLVSIGDT